MSSGVSYAAPAVELISGFTAGVASTAVSHPLELIKTRLQGDSLVLEKYISNGIEVDPSSRNEFGQSYRIALNVLRNEGGAKGLYRGLVPNISGNALSWGIYFALYGDIKDRIRRMQTTDGTLSFSDFFLASAISGLVTVACTNPIWVVKTRMLSTARNQDGSYGSMLHGFRSIYKQDGIRGFYRGLIPSTYGILHGALQFMVYEQLKVFQSRRRIDGELTTTDYLWTSAVSKIAAGTATYPYQVIRSRLQMHGAENAYHSVRDVVAQTWRCEGVFGLYKGLGANLLRVLPSTCVTFIVYESVKRELTV